MSQNSQASDPYPWRWKKGASANPGGRPRSSFDFNDAAREHAPEYLEVLLKSLKSSNWRERHSALAMLMDRAFGKVPLAITGQGGDSPIALHLIAAQLVSKSLMDALEQRTTEQHPEPSNGQANSKFIDLMSLPPPLE